VSDAKSDDRELLDRVQEGFRRVGLTFPYLAGLVRTIDARLDRRVATMGIFASGRLVVNPEFLRGLSAPDVVFLLTHELYHLMLRTHQRSEGTDPYDFNVAHDYIINDILRDELQVRTIPAGGLDWPGARLLSAERILAEMQRDPFLRPPRCWGNRRGLGSLFDPLGFDSHGFDPNGQPQPGDGPPGDVLDADLEREWFPETSRQQQAERARQVEEQAGRAMSLRALIDAMQARGQGAGGHSETVAALRGLYRPPWELALQRWLETVAPGERSYARPSRRGADRTDVVLPGRKREGWTLHIVLDTSGSMVRDIPPALGAIADFCEAAGVERVHLVQCDTAVGSDEVLTPQEVSEWRVTGYGGSDLGPALLRLAEDPEVSAAVVLTDGDIEYPQEGVPYSVLWVLPPWKNAEEFQPRFGRVIAMTHS
jgi:predicted metal-dependent peptidase